MIARFFRYARKVFQLPRLLDAIQDGRLRPQIPGWVVWNSIFLLFLLRLGSLNALEELLRATPRRRTWQSWLGTLLPSADTIGYAAERVNEDSIRQALHSVYTRLQRNHQLSKLRMGGWAALALDGHELFSSYSRHCEHGCQRILQHGSGERVQYDHRIGVAHLVGGSIPILLDAEAQRPGENEIAAALRLLERIQHRYPKAYDVLTADAIYADPKVLSFVRQHHKHLLAVLKKNHPDLLQDAESLCPTLSPTRCVAGKTVCLQWDIDECSSWTTIAGTVRVVRSQETSIAAHPQSTSDWYWVTTFSRSEASTETVARIGHARWDIENDAFNYLSTYYHFDHAFRHHPHAIMAFVLMACLVYTLVSAFYQLDLKSSVRLSCGLSTRIRLFFLSLDSLVAGSSCYPPIRTPT